MDKELLSYAYLLQAGYTHKELKELLIENRTTSAFDLWENTKSGNIPPLSEGRQKKIEEKLEKVHTSRIEEYLLKAGIEIITQFDIRYPKNLKPLRHAPAFFYLRGKFEGRRKFLGVVGSRKHTNYAEMVLDRILPDIIHAGLSIVSGGATGVDTLSHEICLHYGGHTVVVLGTGIDINYPSKNHQLFEKIVQSGSGIISHFPLSTRPEPYNFPMRNEIVAALSSGILIPEAGLSSGTLITAQLALEHGRDVFAVPGDIHRITSEGTNMLIATGQAKCVRCSGDILEEYFDITGIGDAMTPLTKKMPSFHSEEEKLIYELIQDGYKTIDTLLEKSNFEISDILIYTANLEIDGHIALDLMGGYQIKENATLRIIN